MPRLLSTILLIGIIVPTFVGILPTKSNAQFELPPRCQQLIDDGVINESNDLERELQFNENKRDFLETQISLAQEALVYLGRANDLPVVMQNIGGGGMGGAVEVDRNNEQRNQLRNQARELAQQINTNFDNEQIQTTQTYYFGYYINWGPTRQLNHNELEVEIRDTLLRMEGNLLEARDNITVAQICQEQLKPEPDSERINQLEQRLSTERQSQTQTYEEQRNILETEGRRLSALEQSYSNCSIWTTSGLKDCVRDLIGIIFDILTALATFILYTAQTIFNYVLKVSILDFKSLIDGSVNSSNSSIQGSGFAVKTLWGVARDLANMMVIFVLLYIAGATILQLTNIDTKKSLTTLIVVALLINFSGVFTRIAIDASNLTALVFYNQLKSANETEPNIAGAIIKNANIEKILKAPPKPGINTADSMLGQVSKGLGTFIVLILMSWVLLLSAGFFIVRMVSLILLIIISPLAFIGFVIPKIKKKVTTPWIEELTEQLTFAPVFMIMLYFTVTLSNSAQTIRFSNTSNEIIGYSIIYTIIVMMMFATLQVARGSAKGVASSKISSLGAIGAGIVGGAGLGWVGRNSVGRISSRLARSEGLQRWAANSRVGSLAFRNISNLGQASFDVRNSDLVNRARTASGMQRTQGSGNGGFNTQIQNRIQTVQNRANLFSDRAARETYSNRIGSSGLARVGSGGGILSMFARGDRIAASQLMITRRDELRQEINQHSNTVRGLLAEQVRRAALTPPTPLDPADQVVLDELQGTPPGTGRINDLETQRTHLVAELRRLGLENTVRNQY